MLALEFALAIYRDSQTGLIIQALVELFKKKWIDSQSVFCKQQHVVMPRL